MVTDSLIGIVAGFLEWLLGGMLAIVPAVPGWAVEAFDALGQVWAVGRSMDAWVPVTFTVTVVTALFAVYAVALIIGTIKLVASYLTLGGGAT